VRGDRTLDQPFEFNAEKRGADTACDGQRQQSQQDRGPEASLDHSSLPFSHPLGSGSDRSRPAPCAHIFCAPVRRGPHATPGIIIPWRTPCGIGHLADSGLATWPIFLAASSLSPLRLPPGVTSRRTSWISMTSSPPSCPRRPHPPPVAARHPGRPLPRPKDCPNQKPRTPSHFYRGCLALPAAARWNSCPNGRQAGRPQPSAG
jgi:hypothetical protein